MSKRISIKRRIEKVRNMINDVITNSQSNLVLHTAEDAKTLVRTIIDLKLVRIDDGAVTAIYHQIIQRAEAGTTIFNPSTTQFLDAPAATALIWEDAGVANIITAAGDMNVIHIQVDTKGMRKMKENDTIVLSHLATVASAFQVSGNITLFFKE